jgi:triphosphatase
VRGPAERLEVKNHTEVELKFQVPAAARAELVAEMARGSTTRRTSLAALYLDTDDRRLARAGLAWRLRREGRRWVQTLKCGGTNALERFEHEVVRPGARHDASQHAGTPAGDKLIALLHKAHAEGADPGVRFQTQVRRITRTVRTRGALVEVAFDEGRLVSAGSALKIREVEFELVSGSATAMLGLAERWRKRFGLICDPHSKAERGDCLAQGSPFPPVRKAGRVRYSRHADAIEAFGTVLDECLSQIARNAVGLAEGEPAQRVEHVHQLRVGIRRLRSALRSFEGWAPAPPEPLVEGLQSLFTTLGKSRDADVLNSGVVAELVKAGAPPLALPPSSGGPGPVEVVRDAASQQLLLAWIAWCAALAETPDPQGAAAAALAAPTEAPAATANGAPAARQERPARGDPGTFHRAVARRLRRWHARIAADWEGFDELDEARLHALRKRIKRQRYAVEFFAPVLGKGKVERYLGALAAIQDRMGELNDLFVARGQYEALVATDPAAWFALGWLTARIAASRALAKPALGQLARKDSPART